MEEFDEKVKKLQQIIDGTSAIVFFGGAGVSTESGIPDFRSRDGLYNQEWKYPPEEIISRSFFDRDPKEFYRFYRKKLIIKDVKPNITHTRLAELEAKGKLRAVVTQNIDGLHQMAGSRRVFELHGSTLRNFCMDCHAPYGIDFIAESENTDEKIPRCTKCGGIVKPDVVLYEEGLDDDVVNGALKAISEADTLIIGGTSLVVYPAAGFIRYFRGKHLVMINKSETAADASCELVIHDSLGKVFGALSV
ncbi:MAG: NAD-dependent protein deacylase [Treponema sp.]|nr:NAD-dependent protein deacylase [Treponema sp.]